MKKYLIVLAAILCALAANAQQDFTYGEVSMNELAMKSYSKDTAAHAVVLNEFGKARLDMTNLEELRLTYEYHVKIKIFDSKGFDKGTVSIPKETSNSVSEDIEGITGTTTYINDDGTVKKTELEPEKIYSVKENKYWTLVKFALPGLHNGCVIEYKYSIVTPFWQNFHPWHFQNDIPKIYSEFDAHIPAFWKYNIVLQGSLNLTKKIIEVERDCFKVGNASSGCLSMVFGISDIPAFVEEDYMTSPKNFLSAVYFELSEYTSPFSGIKKSFTKQWADVDESFIHAEYFGGQLKRTSFFKPLIAPVIANQATELDKAKAIYAYIKKNIKWDNFYSAGSEDGVVKAMEKHTGHTGDINLALVTALNAADLNTEAVLLSTRPNGIVNKLHPTETDFNYIIAKVNIGDKSYFLDATDPLLPFGMVPVKCINGEGRAMSLKKPSYWVDVKPDLIRKSTFSLDLTLQNDGKIKGTFTHYSFGYDAYDQRKNFKKYNSTDEYLDYLTTKFGKAKIVKSEISNVDSLDAPFIETYDIDLKGYDKLTDRVLFNPFIFDRTLTNPFKLTERNYPVDWGMPSEKRFILTMHLPDGYSVESEPQKIAIGLPNNGGKFITDYQTTGNMYTFSHVTQFNKSIYSSEEYAYLKELYNKIIQSEKAELVFKKKI